VTNNLSGTSVQFSALQTSNFNSITGSPLASFVLGVPESAGRLFGNSEGNMQGKAYSLYFQENFRATPKLTLNMGYAGITPNPMTSKYGSGTFIWETGQYVWDLQNPITGEPANIRRGSIVPDRRGFQPRVGIAYELTPKTVVRTSYGIFFDTFGTLCADATGQSWKLAVRIPAAGNGAEPDRTGCFSSESLPGPGAGIQDSTRLPTCLNVWGVDFQDSLRAAVDFLAPAPDYGNTACEAVYFGSHGLRLSGQIN